MRLSLSFVLPLTTILFVVALATIPLFNAMTMRWSLRELNLRSTLIGDSLQSRMAQAENLAPMLEKTARSQGVAGLAFCDRESAMRARSEHFPAGVECLTRLGESGTLHLASGDFYFTLVPLEKGEQPVGNLLVLHSLDLIERRIADTTNSLLYLFAGLAVVLSLSTTLVARAIWTRFTLSTRELLQKARLLKTPGKLNHPELLPLARDVRALVRDIESDRRARDETQMSWTPQTLKKILNEELAGDEILIVSNQEPYIHSLRNGKVVTQFPASGLVTALEPIMRACSGTWVAHGSGSADKMVVDPKDRVRVPPDHPTYQIRRVWLSAEEEHGYYHGFSNEGMWPLCHMAHTRPIFRTSDWQQYKRVNQRFADVVVEEARTENPVVLVQDYHMALVPRMIRDHLPNATIITFWHIPWPNAEAFGICPWRKQILEGLLGSSILGFHTRFHCNNFIDTVDRVLESRIDRETSTISFGGKLTAIKSYPISIEWPKGGKGEAKSVATWRREVREMNGFVADSALGIGVDRLDYTKGILERFLTVEKMLERHPEFVGRFSFIQIAAPSRSDVEQYQAFESEVRALAARINERFGDKNYLPIHLKIEHHEQAEIFGYFRASDVCLVTSLHDGMNLVAKEFIASREDEQGVLILSQFTGAARELQEALIVNPYDIDACAKALHLALTMSPMEQRERMRSMRGLVQEFNVFRWAGRMLMDAARIRQQSRLSGRLHEAEVHA